MVERTHFVFVILLASAAACGGTSRGLEAYRADANKLLETRSAELVRCYNAALETDATLAGTVTVQFVVEKQTGAIKDVKIDPANTTAPEVLDNCVLNTIAGLALAPPDRNEGRATFVYEFGPPPVPAS